MDHNLDNLNRLPENIIKPKNDFDVNTISKDDFEKKNYNSPAYLQKISIDQLNILLKRQLINKMEYDLAIYNKEHNTYKQKYLIYKMKYLLLKKQI